LVTITDSQYAQLQTEAPHSKHIKINNSLKFNCPKCKYLYCIKCREPWHNGLKCKEYRQRKGYPIDDLLFFKFIKGENIIRWTTCKDWVEKVKWWNDCSCYWNTQLWQRCSKDSLMNSKCIVIDSQLVYKINKNHVVSSTAKPAYNSKCYQKVSIHE
jgi:hypothetical protein